MSGTATPSFKLSSTTTLGAPQAAKCLLVQLRPDACTRAPRQQAHGFSAVAERQNKQACPTILAGLRITHHRTAAVVDLRLFSWCGQDDACGFRTLRSAT